MTESVVIAVTAYGILISFRSRLLKPSDMSVKNITNLKLSKYILKYIIIIYILIVALTMFNLSYLNLSYIIFIQIILLFKTVIYILIFLISFQIILTNVLNISSFQKRYEYLYQRNEDGSYNNYFFTWVQISINIDSSMKITDIL